VLIRNSVNNAINEQFRRFIDGGHGKRLRRDRWFACSSSRYGWTGYDDPGHRRRTGLNEYKRPKRQVGGGFGDAVVTALQDPISARHKQH